MQRFHARAAVVLLAIGALMALAALTGCASGVDGANPSNPLDYITPVSQAGVDQIQHYQEKQLEALADGNLPALGGSSLALLLVMLGLHRRGRTRARRDAEEVAASVAARPIKAPDGGLVTQEDIAKVVRPRAAQAS